MRKAIVLGVLVVGLACQKSTSTTGPSGDSPTLDPRSYPVGLAQCGSGPSTYTVYLRSPNRRYALPSAVVYVAEEGCGVTTDPEGRATLEGLTSGSHTLTIQAGMFRTTLTKQIQTGNQGDTLRLDQGDIRLAVFQGTYDAVEEILDSLGFQYDLYVGYDSLHSESFYSRYNMIFINCGIGEPWGQDTVYPSLMEAFVRQGGRLYVSDLALPFYANGPFPSVVQLFTESAMGEGAFYGAHSMDTVLWAKDSLLRYAEGVDSFQAHLSEGWIVLDTLIPPEAHVLVEGPAPQEIGGTRLFPYAEEITYGEGKIFITSFHLTGVSSFGSVERFLRHVILRY